MTARLGTTSTYPFSPLSWLLVLLSLLPLSGAPPPYGPHTSSPYPPHVPPPLPLPPPPGAPIPHYPPGSGPYPIPIGPYSLPPPDSSTASAAAAPPASGPYRPPLPHAGGPYPPAPYSADSSEAPPYPSEALVASYPPGPTLLPLPHTIVGRIPQAPFPLYHPIVPFFPPLCLSLGLQTWGLFQSPLWPCLGPCQCGCKRASSQRSGSPSLTKSEGQT